MRVLGLVPARGGSKGVPRKNARLIAGKPLLAWTSEAALGSSRLDRVVLSTEDEEIADLGLACGLEVPFRRPSELAQDTTAMIDVVLHTLAWAAAEGEHFDAICLLQPTSPARTSNDIDGCIDVFERSGADTVFTTLAIPTELHPHWAFLADGEGNLQLATGGTEPVSRRQDLLPACHREGSVYVTRSTVIRTSGTLYGDRIRPYPIDPERSVNIDTPADWERAERLLTGRP